jgi:hypothetical protein
VARNANSTYKIQVCLSGVEFKLRDWLLAGFSLVLATLGKGIAEAGLKGEFMPGSKGLVMPGLCIGPGVPMIPLPTAVGFRDRGAGSTRQIEVTFS